MLGGLFAWLWFSKAGKQTAARAGEAVSAGASAVVTGVKSLSRGIRNNNPGNLRISGSRWQGKIPTSQNTDGAFEQFIDMPSGIRALAKTLRTYYHTHGLRSVRQIVSRWAPPSENPTAKYVEYVAKRAGVSPDQPININDPALLTNITAGIIQFENGAAASTISPADLSEGVSRALA